MTARLIGRTALVTGAATGMGRATAERFSAEGAKVILFGLGGVLLDQAAQAARGVAVHGDVTRSEDIAQAIAACGGRLDIVVNAAGLIALDEPETVTDEGWSKTFAVNVTGAMMVCRAALPLLKRDGGSIVNIASIAALYPSVSASYAASKAALITYTRTLAYAHGADRIRANAVAPGWVRTPMSEHEMMIAAERNGSTPEAEFQALSERIALRRIAAPEEIASCCLFLASDEASFVTGTVLVADGGGRAQSQNRAA